MPKESIILGTVGIVLGLGILVKTGTAGIIPALIPILIGLALIIFNKEEDKIEKRRDKK